MKIASYCGIALLMIGSLSQISYLYVDFTKTMKTDPTLEELLEHAKPFYLPFELSCLFFVDVVLLYISVFFMVAVMASAGLHSQVLQNIDLFAEEKKRVKIIMCVYGTSYLLRSATYFVQGLYLEQIITFIRAYPEFYELINFGFYLIYDILPIGLLYLFHHQNFRTFNNENTNETQMMIEHRGATSSDGMTQSSSAESSLPSELQSRSSSNASQRQNTLFGLRNLHIENKVTHLSEISAHTENS